MGAYQQLQSLKITHTQYAYHNKKNHIDFSTILELGLSVCSPGASFFLKQYNSDFRLSLRYHGRQGSTPTTLTRT